MQICVKYVSMKIICNICKNMHSHFQVADAKDTLPGTGIRPSVSKLSTGSHSALAPCGVSIVLLLLGPPATMPSLRSLSDSEVQVNLNLKRGHVFR